MRIFDAHCDVLYKMMLDPTIRFLDDQELHVNLRSLMKSNVKIQTFAIFVPESVHADVKFNAALYMIELFYSNIMKPYPEMQLIQSRKDIQKLKINEIGAILSLEGCDAIGNDLIKLKTLLRLGVSAVGLTWNYANAVADGVLEKRGAGITSFGKKVIDLLNDAQVSCDVSHLSERGFWDVMECAQYPYASHSNCYSLCSHPRNLKDAQIRALINKDSVIGITFVPEFLSSKSSATITDILRHIDYVCSLGGENHVGFGSDFDGIDHTVINLSSAKEYDHLVNELIKHYSNIQVEKFLFKNMMKRIPVKS
ncbi:dipeptidase [Bacillus aquiflavi]|uniref:Dipeptidase n=1 Tax=Bacillus aquiflavi TaxID=2672567 RepID=A0A6B3VWE9_9BACI|nr:dipeptidase [Bacillus aquiflavi]MBA4536267.1 dipeptidase [Bacillus aquiflavi]NEY80635.1 membrane dipeptidase [Bacillus aquiflavi]UAC49447.1 dipeptidase [Bacillus aquiflavi]